MTITVTQHVLLFVLPPCAIYLTQVLTICVIMGIKREAAPGEWFIPYYFLNRPKNWLSALVWSKVITPITCIRRDRTLSTKRVVR